MGDAEKLLSLELSELEFDVVLSMFTLTHLKSATTLEKVVKNIFQVLKSDSIFVGAFPNVIADAQIAKKYNFSTDFNPKKYWHGSHYTNTLRNLDGTTFDVREMYITRDIFRRYAENAGFLDAQFFAPVISEEGKKEKSGGFWKEFLEIPLAQFFVCKKF